MGKGLTCALFQLDIAAHMDVVYSDMSSGRMIKKSLKHHLNKGTEHEDVLLRRLIAALYMNDISLEMTPDILWGFGAGWYVPPSSESPGLLSEPKAAFPLARCPSAAPSDSLVPPPAADSRRPDRVALAPAPPQGSAAALVCVGCGRLHPDGGSFPRNLGREEQHAALSRHRAVNLKPLILPSVLLAFSPFHCIPL